MVEIQDTSQVSLENPNYKMENGRLKKGDSEIITEVDLKGLVFNINGFRLRNLIEPTATSGYCQYQVKAGGTGLGEGVRDLSLMLELKYPTEDGDCMAATKRMDSALGETYQRTSIKIQREEKFEGVGEVGDLHKYWEAKQYGTLLNKAIGVINTNRNDLNEVVAYYYAAAANIMLNNRVEALKYIELFEQENYSSYKNTEAYKKIKMYLSEAKNKLP